MEGLQKLTKPSVTAAELRVCDQTQYLWYSDDQHVT
jgi:hypothetical protein